MLCLVQAMYLPWVLVLFNMIIAGGYVTTTSDVTSEISQTKHFKIFSVVFFSSEYFAGQKIFSIS